jgi:hypothetical protein
MERDDGGRVGRIETELRGRLPGLLQAQCAERLMGYVSGGIHDLRRAGISSATKKAAVVFKRPRFVILI